MGNLTQLKRTIGNIGKYRFGFYYQNGDTKITYLPTICSFMNDFRPPNIEYVNDDFSRKHIHVGLVWLQWWVGFSISIK